MALRTTLAVIVVAGAFALPTALNADIVIFQNGDRREGRVEAIPGEPNRILLITGSQRLQIRRDLIEEVIEQDDATDYAILGNQLIRSQSLDRALEMFKKALEYDATNPGAREGHARAERLIAERAAEAERRLLAQNSERVQAARDAMTRDQYDQADVLLEEVLNSTTDNEQRAALQRMRRDMFVDWADSRLDRMDPAGAEEIVARALEIDPGNIPALDLQLQVWETNPARREDVLNIYDQKLVEAPEDLELHKKRADILAAMARPEDSIDSLIKLQQSGQYRAQGIDARLQAALRTATERFGRQGRLDDAIKTYEKLLEIYPDTDRQPLAYLHYERRLLDIEPDDWEARAALLKSLVESGMADRALSEAELILRNDPENEVAIALVRERAEDDLKELEAAMNRRQFDSARTLSTDFVNRYGQRFPDLLQTATDLNTRATVESERQRRAVREQARELVTVGDQYMAEARRNVALMRTAEAPSRTIVAPPRTEAVKNVERAIQAYEGSLRLDPSVGPMIGGLDVTTKLTDARLLRAELTRAPIVVQTPTGVRR